MNKKYYYLLVVVVVVVDVNKIQCLCFVFPLVSGFEIERQGEDEHHKEVALHYL